MKKAALRIGLMVPANGFAVSSLSDTEVRQAASQGARR
jgi:hypothetical protein